MDRNRLATLNRIARGSSSHSGWVVLAWLIVTLAAGVAGWTGRDALSSTISPGDASTHEVFQRWTTEQSQTRERHLVCASEYAGSSPQPGRVRWVDLGSSTAAQLSQQSGQCYLAMWEGQDAVAPSNSSGDQHEDPAGSPPTPQSLALLSPAFLESWQAEIASGSLLGNSSDVVHADIARAERVALPLTLLVLLIATRNPMLAILPLLAGVTVSVIATGVLTVFASQVTITVHVLSIVTMLGLALGIDYALLWIFQAKRRQLLNSSGVAWAAGTPSATILKAGAVVIGASLGLLAIPLSIFREVMLGIAIVVLVAVLAAFTLVPSLARLLPGKDLTLSHPSRHSFPLVKLAGMWRPERRLFATRLTAIPALAILVGLGWQAIDLRTAITVQPPESTAQQASATEPYDSYMEVALLEVRLSSVDVVISGEQYDRSLGELLAFIGGDADFAPMVIVDSFPGNSVHVLRAIVVRPPDSALASEAINRLRQTTSNIQVRHPDSNLAYGGPLVTYEQVVTAIEERQVLAGVLAVSVAGVLMMLLIGMPLVSLVAVGGSLLSFAAALGALVLIAQRGVGASLLGIEQVSHIESWVPIVVFCVVLGVGIDYHMFLMGGVLDAVTAGRPRGAAIEEGYRTVWPVVATAALTMTLVFGGFVRGEMVAMQQLGIGLACGVMLDAFIVRLILVRSMMGLVDRFGRRLLMLIRNG